MEKVSNEKITIVVPIYNTEEYLERCVNSILNQSYKNLEIILVDDESPDNCPELCEKFKTMDNRVVVIHKKNGGLSDARNAGIEIATGKYISFVDSDDYIESDYIQVLYDLIKKYKSKISMVDINRRFDSGKIINNSNNQEFVLNQKEFFEKMLYGERDFDNSASAKLYETALFNDVRYPVGRLYEDTATTYKIILKCNEIPVKSVPLYNYMIRATSIVQCSFNEKKLQIIESTKEMTNAVKKKYPDLENACLRKEAWSYFSTLSQMALSNYRNKELENKMISFININRKKLLSDKRLSNRDKFGIICIRFGFGFYKFSWRLYTKIKYGRNENESKK